MHVTSPSPVVRGTAVLVFFPRDIVVVGVVKVIEKKEANPAVVLGRKCWEMGLENKMCCSVPILTKKMASTLKTRVVYKVYRTDGWPIVAVERLMTTMVLASLI